MPKFNTAPTHINFSVCHDFINVFVIKIVRVDQMLSHAFFAIEYIHIGAIVIFNRDENPKSVIIFIRFLEQLNQMTLTRFEHLSRFRNIFQLTILLLKVSGFIILLPSDV